MISDRKSMISEIPRDKWERVSKDVECSIHPANYMLDGLDKALQIYNFTADDLFFCYYDDAVEYWFYDNSYAKFGKRFFDMFMSDDVFFRLIAKKHYEAEDNFDMLAEKILSLDMKRCTDKGLIKLYREFFDFFTTLYAYSCPLSSMEIDIPIVTNEVISILDKRNRIDLLPVVTTPKDKTNFGKEKDELLYLNKKFSQSGLKKYLDRYYWIHYGSEGHVLNSEDVLENLNRDESESSDGNVDVNVIEKNLNLNDSEKKTLKLARFVVYFKAMRKYLMFKSACDVRPVLLEIAARLGISFKQLHYLHIDEVEDALLNNNFDMDEIEKRMDFAGYIWFNGKRILLKSDEGKKFHKSVSKMPERLSEMKGTPAMGGKARGRIKKIADIRDASKMEDGDILVSYATNPNLVPIMSKASAILTEEGGLTCHAAIFAREFKIPCVVGIKNIMAILEDDQVADVDATHGIVNIKQ